VALSGYYVQDGVLKSIHGAWDKDHGFGGSSLSLDVIAMGANGMVSRIDLTGYNDGADLNSNGCNVRGLITPGT
jgi:hypothetical protein